MSIRICDVCLGVNGKHLQDCPENPQDSKPVFVINATDMDAASYMSFPSREEAVAWIRRFLYPTCDDQGNVCLVEEISEEKS
jgi:hypothetical protein